MKIRNNYNMVFRIYRYVVRTSIRLHKTIYKHVCITKLIYFSRVLQFVYFKTLIVNKHGIDTLLTKN